MAAWQVTCLSTTVASLGYGEADGISDIFLMFLSDK